MQGSLQALDPRCPSLCPEEVSLQDTVALVLECRREKNLVPAIRLYNQTVDNGYESINSIRNHLVPLFVDCGRVSPAEQVFQRLESRSEHAWTSLVKGFADLGDFTRAFEIFEQMAQDCVQPTRHTFVILLKLCVLTSKLEPGRCLHSMIIELGYDKDMSLVNATVDLYGQCSFLEDALAVFDQAYIQDVILYNTMISLYVDQGFSEEAISCLNSMQLKSMSPDAITFGHILKTCRSIGDFGKCKLLHHMIIAKGYESEPFIVKNLVRMYSSRRLIADAEAILEIQMVEDVMSWSILMEAYLENGLSNKVLDCKEKLQADGLPQNPTVFIYCVKACGDLGDLCRGQELHLEVVKYGYQGSIILATALITMYAKCGSIHEARKVFDELNVRDTIAWTAMIVGYTEHGFAQEALSILEDMQRKNAAPDAITLACGLKACGTIKDIKKGWVMHAEIVKEGFETYTSVANTLLDMYAKFCFLTETRDVFTECTAHDVVSWNTLINAYTDGELYEDAIDSLEMMQKEGIAPDESTFVSCLKACCYAGLGYGGKEMHTQIIVLGFEMDVSIGSILLDMYCRCGWFAEAEEVFNTLPVRNIITWSVLIQGYLENGLATEALKCSEQMLLNGICPDTVLVVCMLKACSKIGSIDLGKELHSYTVKIGFEDDSAVGATLVHFYVQCRQLLEAQEIFNKLHVRDTVSWTALISGFIDLGLLDDALHSYHQMKLDGVSPNAVTLFCVLQACCSMGNLDVGREVHLEATTEEWENDINVTNALIDLYGKCGSFAEAIELFDEQHLLRDVMTWSAVITRCAEQGDIDTAFLFYKRMQEQGLASNDTAIMSLLKVFGDMGALENGRRIHAQMGPVYGVDVMFNTAVLDMYAKGGSMIEAQLLFDRIPGMDIVGFNALLNGYARHGQSDEVRCLFERMKEEQLEPNETTYLNLLTGCNHAGLVGKGQELFGFLCSGNGFTPTAKHVDCIVDSFGRAGQLDEAAILMQEMPFQVDAVSWISILGACRKLSNVEAGRSVFESATQLNKIGSASFVLMSNIYSIC